MLMRQNWSFNSKLVRLEVYLKLGWTLDVLLFQFQTGAIKREAVGNAVH